ncbi:mucin-2-like [Sitophilus oryzae]|uniref:Mucin-2-like n=1 Tax=Sitophilus oryzae TaxID=7048 RepID=A0A6J2XPA5_SITOR|nr:mucin-2-like [Sitophilus oryzae]
MIRILFFGALLLDIAFSQTTIPPPVCPSQEPTDPAIYLPDDYNCGAFYECNGGQATRLVCPSGTYYDESLNVCNFAEDVTCGTRPTTPEPPTSSQGTTLEPTSEVTTSFTGTTESPPTTTPPWFSTESTHEPWETTSKVAKISKQPISKKSSNQLMHRLKNYNN